MVALNELTDLGVTIWDFSTGVRVDLDSFEGRVSTTLKAEFAQQFREQIRKHTTTAMFRKAEQGFVTGGLTFGYDNVGPKGSKRWQVNAEQAAVVREIYERFAEGAGVRAIAAALNRADAPKPRAQQGRADGWSAATVGAILDRPLYRGQIVYGRSAKAYGRELGPRAHRRDGKVREKGQQKRPEESWIRLPEDPTLRIIDSDLAERVDARRLDRRTRYLASVANGGRVPERAHGKYLLSGGMLVCPTCNGHFEARKYPRKGHPGDIYICSTRRRKPGVCTNTLALPIADTDDQVLSIVEGQVLGTRLIEELIALVDRGDVDESAHLSAEHDRLTTAIARLVGSIEDGVPATTVAPVIKERQAELARVETRLQVQRPTPNIERLRAALEQRAEAWKADLRAEPAVARLVVRRLIGPIVLWEDATAPDECRWDAPTTPTELLAGLPEVTRGWMTVCEIPRHG